MSWFTYQCNLYAKEESTKKIYEKEMTKEMKTVVEIKIKTILIFKM